MKNVFSSWMKKRSKRRRTERWAEASEAKRQIKLIVKQVKAEKAAVEALIGQLRSIITRQVFEGDAAAAHSTGRIYKRAAMKCALLMIRRYCACLLHHLPLLAREGSFPALPLVVQEAVAGLMFASRRCDSPELAVAMTGLAELLEERYAPEGGEALRVIDGMVDRILREEYLGEEELDDDMKFQLGNLIASRCDLGLKFQLGKEKIESLFRVTEEPEGHEGNVFEEEGRYDSYEGEECETSFKTCDGMGFESVSVSDEDDRSTVHT